MIPAADIRERYLHAHIGLDQLRNLPHAVAEPPVGYRAPSAG